MTLRYVPYKSFGGRGQIISDLEIISGYESTMRICNKKYFEFSLKLFGRGGSKSGGPYAMSRTKVSGVGVKSFQILKLFRGTKALLLLLLILFFILIF